MRLFKLFLALSVFVFSVALFAQAPSAAPSAVPAIVAAAPVAQPSGGGAIWLWINAHGGPVASLILVVGSFNVLCSMLRNEMAKWDGVDLSQPIPVDKSKLTLMNKLALLSGKLLDLLMANVQHK